MKHNFSKNACRKPCNPSFESLVSSECILHPILSLEILNVVLLGHRGHLPSKIIAKYKPFNTHLSTSNSNISALGRDRDMGFLRGHQGRQGHRPHDDDDDEVEDNDNDKDDDNNKDDNNDKGISALGLDRDLGFS